jgi:hypothetical protein
MICLREREGENASAMRRESEKKNGEEWDSFHMMNNERRRHSLSLSTYACRSIAFCIASLLTRTHIYARCQSRWKQKNKEYGHMRGKKPCLSCINSTLLSTRFLFPSFFPNPLHIWLALKQEITCLSLFHYTHTHTTSYAMRFVTHAISHASASSLRFSFFFLFLLLFW